MTASGEEATGISYSRVGRDDASGSDGDGSGGGGCGDGVGSLLCCTPSSRSLFFLPYPYPLLTDETSRLDEICSRKIMNIGRSRIGNF